MDAAPPPLLKPASAGNDFLALFLSHGARQRHGDHLPTSRGDVTTPCDETGAQLREQDPRIAPNRGPISQLAGWLRQTTYILTLKPPTARNAAACQPSATPCGSDRCYEQGRGVSLPLGIAAEAQALHLSIVRRSAYRAAEASPPAPPALGSLGNICQAFSPHSPGGESAAHGLHERGARSSGASGQDTGARAGESGPGRRRCAHTDTATGGRCRGPVGGFLGY